MGKPVSSPQPLSSLLPPFLLLFILLCQYVDQIPATVQTGCKTYYRCRVSESERPCVDKKQSLACTEASSLETIADKLNSKSLQSFSNDSCDSKSITCNCSIPGSIYCHVTELVFRGEDLTGIVPPELADLKFLERISLYNNKLSGSIPESLGNLSQLSKLDLSQNSLEGHIPKSLGRLQFLTFLDLSENNLHGRIPESLGNLSKLQQLDLSLNSLNGHIPSGLFRLQSLRLLRISKNFLEEQIPENLVALPSLIELSLYGNKLSGRLPVALGNITNLETLDLSENKLFGELPSELGKLKNLVYIDLSVNDFNGTLPQSYQNLTNLDYFWILGNDISGQIPRFIENWKNLSELSLIGNNFDGPLPDGISELVRLEKLWVSDLRSNTGFSFKPLSNLTYMKSLILRNCSISSTIPEDIDKMVSLSYLDLSFNKLNGEIPKSIMNLNLTYLYLTNNMLNGSIPTWILSIKPHVDLSYNNFTKVDFPPPYNNPHVNLFSCCPSNLSLGSPLQIMNKHCHDQRSKFESLYINCGGESITLKGNSYESDLNPNGCSAFYASSKGNWAYSSTGDFSASSYGYEDYIRNRTCGISVSEERLYLTARLSPLSLKYYGLCLHNGRYNVTLHFAEIVFAEENYHRILGKRIFDVFIQGQIMLKDFNIIAEAGANQTLERNFIAVVNDSILEIHFYWGGKGSIYINPGLYGPLISAISVTRELKNKKLSTGRIAGITVSSVVILAVLVVAFLWKMGWLGRKELHDIKVIENQDSSVTLGQIIDATQNFSPEKRIGRGGFGTVYKAELQNGTVLAVKQLSHNSRQGTQEFLTEVGILTSLRNENLVRLLGSYSGEDQVLLIYEYMENNSLASALFGTVPNSELNWEVRYNISLGVAKGLLFLHTGSKMKIIHRDIKASNILLDRDFNPKISDFGLAKLYDGDQTHIQDKVGGTEGYIAPEYAARGHFSEKTDVYSYGVLILEIISGRSNAQRKSDESVYLVDDAIVYLKEGRLLDLIDKNLSKYPVTDAMKMLNLALTCINHTPQLRPTMSEVVDILEGKKAMERVPTINRPDTQINISRSTGTSTQGTSSGLSSYFSGRGGDESNYMSTDSHHDILDDNAASEKPLIA